MVNKDLGKTFSIKKEFNLFEIDTKADCIFNLSENNSGNLSCDLNVERHKNIKTFSFMTSLIETNEGDEIYFSKMNELILINNIEEEKEDEEKEEQFKTKKTMLYIAIIIICCIVFCGVIGVAIFLIKKCLKSKIDNIEN